MRIQEAGSTQWFSAEAGMSLTEGDTIKTGKGASLELSMDDNDNIVVSLYENSTAILRGNSLERIELPEGRIRSYVRRLGKGSSFEIKTPTVIAGARGSGWDVEASKEGFSTVSAFEDVIFVKALDGQGNVIEEKDLSQDYRIRIDRNRRFSGLSKINASDKGKWKQWKDKKRIQRKNIMKRPRQAQPRNAPSRKNRSEK